MIEWQVVRAMTGFKYSLMLINQLTSVLENDLSMVVLYLGNDFDSHAKAFHCPIPS